MFFTGNLAFVWREINVHILLSEPLYPLDGFVELNVEIEDIELNYRWPYKRATISNHKHMTDVITS